MPYVYKFEWGQYSDYTEVWYFHKRKMRFKQLFALMESKLLETVTERVKLGEQQWDECEKLFGMRTWPYWGKFIPPKGTLEEFRVWRDKWLGKLSFFSVWLELCGFQRLKPHLEIDIGDSIYDEKDAINFISKAKRGEIKEGEVR